MADPRAHWDAVYAGKAEGAVSWFQDSPATSLALIRTLAPDKAAPIIDIGGGRSRLAAALLQEGWGDVTVLDISAVALEQARAALPAGSQAAWIAADITAWRPSRRYRLWHDRAVFHFLIDRAAQDAYLAALDAGTESGAHIIIAAFAPDGPSSCSGLPVQRWSAEALAARLGPAYRLLTSQGEQHQTPWATRQSFLYTSFQKN